ncbi:MAG: glycosyltransferase family 4 protein [Planctomycetota bacterium]
MKIAYVVINANRREGTSRAVLEVAERLAENHEVDLLARTVEDVDFQRVRWRRVSGPGWPEVGDFASFVWRCDRLLRQSDYDIVHAAGPNCTAADVYTIQTVHPVKRRIMLEIGAHTDASLPRRLTRHLYDRAVLSTEAKAYRAHGPRGRVAYLPVSAGTRGELENEYPVVEALVREIPNGADLDRFHPRHRAAARSDIRRQHGMEEDDFVAVFSGGDWVRKGLRIAAEAVAQSQTERARLLVVGHDPLVGEFRAGLERDGLSQRVVFAGFQKEVHRYYAASDVMVFPTAYEAFSLATIEAAASGLPVLMPDVSGAHELVGHGQAGSLLPRTAEAFAAEIDRLAEHPQDLDQLSKSARGHVEEHFHWDKIAAATESVYQELLQQRQSTSEYVPAVGPT